MTFDLTLTFDNGPEPDVTPFVLDTLASRGVRTTFFTIGQKLAQHRILAARAHAEGHWIGNHTWTHSRALGERTIPGEAADEILRTQAALGTLAHPDRLFRPMGGGGRIGPHLLNEEAARLLREGGYTCVLWSSVPRDWIDPDAWVDRALADCVRQPWTLMVLHDLPSGAMRQLPRFLDEVVARGGRFQQAFPPDCVPILRGTPARDITPFVTPPASRPTRS